MHAHLRGRQKKMKWRAKLSLDKLTFLHHTHTQSSFLFFLRVIISSTHLKTLSFARVYPTLGPPSHIYLENRRKIYVSKFLDITSHFLIQNVFEQNFKHITTWHINTFFRFINNARVCAFLLSSLFFTISMLYIQAPHI